MTRPFRLMRVSVLHTILALALVSAAAAGPMPLIFDTDMGNDIDDVLALALIHAFERRGECHLVAVTLTKDNRYAAPFVDLVNSFYGRGDVPIGVVRGGKTPEDGNYLRQMATAEDNGRPRYPHKLRDGHDAPEATALLRRVLAAQADGSTAIVQVGFSTNLARLLDSGPDAASPLDGKTLVRQKVRLLSAMAGNFAAGPRDRFTEYNVVTDIPAAKKVFHEWPTPVVFSGFEIGNAILYPHRSIEQNYRYVPHHPVAEAYRLYGKMPYDRPTWDLTSVLYAVRSQRCPFGISPPGRVTVEDDGVTRFRAEPSGPHRYLTVNREQARGIRDAFADLCSEQPDGVTQRQQQEAEALRKEKLRTSRATPEKRVQLENNNLRLDFDPRTSGTDYNYIWVRRPDGGWERVHNFGVDVGSFDSDDQREMNCIGMNLALKQEGRAMTVTYPAPLVQYRQFDDRIGAPEMVRKYPDFTPGEVRRLVHANASIQFRYELDAQRPSFVVSGRVLQGRISSIVYIIDALWTNNHALPTHELVEGRPEFDPSRPEDKKACAQVAIEKTHYAIFYRRDGQGVPFALLPLVPEPARVCNYFDNWKCFYDFRTSELNQQYIPDAPPVTGANDTGYITSPRADGTLAPVRVAFFPELGWGQGGKGDELRERIVRAVKKEYPAPWAAEQAKVPLSAASASSAGPPAASAPLARIPILHSTDLLHPHDDPDDHYDLATLFAMPEFDVRGVVLDQGERQSQRSGRPAVEQMLQIAGRKAPYAHGLSRRLRARDDRALDEPAEFQGGVRLVLSTLREAKEPVMIFTAGSCRDVAAAFNREPDLLRRKVRAIYFNVGCGPNDKQDEWNVQLDPAAYLRLFESGLPLYWCPCFGKDGYETYYVADQAKVIGACATRVRNYFVYCLTKPKAEPLAFLDLAPQPLPTGPRNMWCTAPMFHAAGRKIYRRGPDDFAALPPEAARKAGLEGKEIEVFRFVPMRATVSGRAGNADPAALAVKLDPPEPNGFVFRITSPQYRPVMASCLKNLLADLGR